MNSVSDRKLSEAGSALNRGDLNSAEMFASEVLQDDCNNSTAHLILGGVNFRRDRYVEACSHFGAVLVQNSNSFEANQYLAESLRRQNRVDEALTYALRAEAISSTSEATYTVALCLISLSRFREAISRLERFLKTKNLAIARHYLALCLIKSERANEALSLLRVLIEDEPHEARHALLLGQAFVQLHRYSEAMAIAEGLLNKSPMDLGANCLAAQALSKEGRVAGAESYILAALKVSPNSSTANSLYGIWLHQMGRFSQADEYFDRALAVDPHQPLPLFLKYEGKRFVREDQPIISKMEAYASSERTSDFERIALHFGIGKAYLDLGDLDLAFKNYDLAHELAYRYHDDVNRHDSRRLEELFDRTQELFTEDFFADWEKLDVPSELPILVMGSIRSGTTLLEQIISSHANVCGVGEVKFWPDEAYQSLDESGTRLSRAKLESAAARYLAVLEELGRGSRKVVDKMPTNWIYAGFIAAALPGAKLVHIRRNAVDTALSIWMTYISEPAAFANRKDWIVSMLRHHENLANHWANTLPKEKYLQVSYEQLTSNPEAVIPKIIEYCGLDWDPACLHPENNEKFVSTPSLFRVRKPIDRTSTAKAIKYKSYLGEFARLLELA